MDLLSLGLIHDNHFSEYHPNHEGKANSASEPEFGLALHHPMIFKALWTLVKHLRVWVEKNYGGKVCVNPCDCG